MRKFSYLIKKSLMLVLLLLAGRMSGQTRIEYTAGASTTFERGTMNLVSSNRGSSGCPQIDLNGSLPWLLSDEYAQVNFTIPVTKVVVEFFGADGDTIHLDVNGTSYAIKPSMMSCGFVSCSVSSSCRIPTYSNGNIYDAGPNAFRLTITGTLINNFRITCLDGDFGLSNFTYTPCGGAAPTLSKTTISNRCPSITLDLNSLVTSTKPSGSILKWYTDAARTTELTTPTAVTANGTYYAFYKDTNNNCFSPASDAVQAEFISCPINIDNTCPSPSVDLSFSLDSSNVVPEGYTQTYHSATPASSANRLPSSVVTSSGTYYYALFSESLTSYSGSSLRPLVVTITNCCVTAN